MPKKEDTHTFKSSPEFTNWMCPKMAGIDRAKSEVIRCCIMLSLPTIVSNPSLIDHVRFDDIDQDK